MSVTDFQNKIPMQDLSKQGKSKLVFVVKETEEKIPFSFYDDVLHQLSNLAALIKQTETFDDDVKNAFWNSAEYESKDDARAALFDQVKAKIFIAATAYISALNYYAANLRSKDNYVAVQHVLSNTINKPPFSNKKNEIGTLSLCQSNSLFSFSNRLSELQKPVFNNGLFFKSADDKTDESMLDLTKSLNKAAWSALRIHTQR